MVLIMKKIFLIFTLIVSGYVFSEEREYQEYSSGLKMSLYEVCSNTRLVRLNNCVNSYLMDGFKLQSGVHAVQTPKGTLFFQSLIRK